MSTTILVVGATGKQGGQALSTLMGSGQNLSLRFLTRSKTSAKAQSLVNKGATAFEGDLNHPESLDKALQGVDRAFFVTDAGAGEEKETEQGVNFVDAAVRAGLKHVVFTSVCAAEDGGKTVPHFRSKYNIEQHLKKSGISYTILRPVAFMDNFPKEPGFARCMTIGFFFACLGTNDKIQLIATEDIGAVAGKALVDPENSSYKNAEIDLSAGEYTISDLRKAIRSAQGHDPWFATWTPTAMRRLIPYDFRQMMYYFENPGYPPTDVNALKKIHPGLLSFEDWLKE